MTFNEMGLIEPIAKALAELDYVTPTAIQQQAIPIIINGIDVMGCAQTGTGKTAAFSIPILQKFYGATSKSRTRPIKALVLTPTRELAIQIDESFAAYGKYTGLTHAVIFGGVGQKPQTDALARGIDILVATPGRLLDLINQGFISLKGIEFFVLDEADRMLDMGFVHDIKRVLALLPSSRQTLFFSATMPREISSLASSMLTKPKRIEVTPVSSTVEIIEQRLYNVGKNDKTALLIDILANNPASSALVFARTKHGSDKIVKQLQKAGISCAAIHGNKSQNARQAALANFKERTIRVMIATDIAARGIDIDMLELVVNYDLPNVPETYVHRIGRTGRAGASGVAVSFCDPEEVPLLHDIEKLIGFRIEVIHEHPFRSLQTVVAAIAKKEELAGKDAQKSRSASRGRNNASRYRRR